MFSFSDVIIFRFNGIIKQKDTTSKILNNRLPRTIALPPRIIAPGYYSRNYDK